MPSILVQHLLAIKRQGNVTFGTPGASACQSAISFSAADALPLPSPVFSPATPLASSRHLPVHLTQSDSILAGVSHSRSNVRVFNLTNFDLEPRSVVFPSPLLGSASDDESLALFRASSPVPSCALIVPWEMRGEIALRSQQASTNHAPIVRPGMTMGIGERWNDTVRLSCGEYGQPASASDYAERVGTLSARKILAQRLERGDVVHELTIKGAKHIGDGFLRTLADVSQEKCIRNVSHVKKRWAGVHYAVQCVVLGEQAATSALEAEINKRAEADDDDDDDDDNDT